MPGMFLPPDQYDVNSYIHNKWLDLLLDPSKAVNDTMPPVKELPWWMPQDRTISQDKMLVGPRPGYDRLRQPIVAPPAAPMPQLDYMPNGPGMLKVGAATPLQNESWLEQLIRVWQEGAGAPRPQGYDPRRAYPRGYSDYGVNGNPVPNPNPPPRPQGSGVRG